MMAESGYFSRQGAKLAKFFDYKKPALSAPLREKSGSLLSLGAQGSL